MGACMSLIRGKDDLSHLRPEVDRLSIGQRVDMIKQNVKDSLVLNDEARWRNPEEAANVRDVLESTTLPEFMDNAGSVIMARRQSLEDAYSQNVSPHLKTAKRRMSDVGGAALEGALKLVVSPKKDPRKQPQPPPPPPKKGLDAKHAQIAINFSPAGNEGDRKKSSTVQGRRRSLEDQLTPSTAKEIGEKRDAEIARRNGYVRPSLPVATSPGGESHIQHARSNRPAPKIGPGGRRGSTTDLEDGRKQVRVRRGSIEGGGGGRAAAGIVAPKKAVMPKGGVMNEFQNPGAANAVVRARRTSLPGYVNG